MQSHPLKDKNIICRTLEKRKILNLTLTLKLKNNKQQK